MKTLTSTPFFATLRACRLGIAPIAAENLAAGFDGFTAELLRASQEKPLPDLYRCLRYTSTELTALGGRSAICGAGKKSACRSGLCLHS